MNYRIVKILENQGFIHCATFTNQKNFGDLQNTKTLFLNQVKATDFQGSQLSNSIQSSDSEKSFKQDKTSNQTLTVDHNSQEHNQSKLIVVALKYIGREKKPIIHSLKRISKPSLRWYSADPIPQSLGGLGIFMVSTSLGIMTDKEARTKKLGGEILLEVW